MYRFLCVPWVLFTIVPPRNSRRVYPFRTTVPLWGQNTHRYGDKTLTFQVVCPQNGTAVLKGLRDSGSCSALDLVEITPM